ncbi:hypothetical protein PVAP13_4NG157017 [Panicum virgatum]|uniref:Uncharacterized protein n=1 Tax=Panicum virgatum TaxID=38727 RepID=A0A8T0T0V5_PANVG|nr:hypothetical protein PVAP13_4NG157017 [Panicum virgatum]
MKQLQDHRPPSARWWSSDLATPNEQPSHHTWRPTPLLPTPHRREVQISRGTGRSGRGRTGSDPETLDPSST